MIEMIGGGMALVDGIVFVIEQPSGMDPSSVEDTEGKQDSEQENIVDPTSHGLAAASPVEDALEQAAVSPEERRRAQWRESQRRRRANAPRKNRPVGERTRAEQIRAAGRDYYRRHREEILLRRRALKEGAA